MDKGSKPILYIALAVLALFAVWWMLRMLSIGSKIANARLPQLPHLPKMPHLPKLPQMPSKWPNLPQRPPPSTQPSQPAQQPEVFWVRSEGATPDMAASVCAPYGATVATLDQLQAELDAGAQWCSAALLQDSATTLKGYWPNLDNPQCGALDSINSQDLYQGQPLPSDDGVNCFGIKPSKSDVDTNIVGSWNWSTQQWSRFSQ
jgi:hypothetical protein